MRHVAAPQGRNSRAQGAGWASLLIALAVLAAIAVLAGRRFEDVATWLEGLGPLAPLAFGCVYVVLVTCGFPVAVLGWLAGAMFGVLPAVVVLIASALGAASLIFWLARALLGRWVRRAAASRPRVARFLALVDEDSLRIMVLLRLSPLHFGLICYLGGAGRIRFWPYLAATLCVAPSAVLQAYAGHATRLLGARAGDGAAAGPWPAGLLIVGIAASFLLTWLLGRMAQRALANEQPAAPPAGAQREHP